MLMCIGIKTSSDATVPTVAMVTPLVSCNATEVPAVTIAVASRPSVFVSEETEVNTSLLVAVVAVLPVIVPVAVMFGTVNDGKVEVPWPSGNKLNQSVPSTVAAPP